MARYIASSLRSKVLYLVSRGLSVFEKKAIGLQVLPTSCCNTAPTALLKASVMMLVGASGLGYVRREVFAMVCLISLKAFRVFSSQLSGCLAFVVVSKV